MSRILETSCHKLSMGTTVGPGPDKEHQNAQGLASAITLIFCVRWEVSASVYFQTGLGCFWV